MAASIAFLLYCGLLVSVPALLIFQGTVPGGLVSLLAGAALATLAATALPFDRTRSSRLVDRGFLVGIAGAFLVLLVQIVPLPGGPLIHPLWTSAGAALGDKTGGFVTIDLGTTLLAICRLTALVAVGLLAALLALHRERAGQLLAILAAIATLVSLAHIAGTFWSLELVPWLPVGQSGPAVTISMFGAILSAALTIRGLERSRNLQSRRRSNRGPLLSSDIAAAIVAFLINLAAVVCDGDVASLFAVLYGTSLLIAVLVIRRRHLSPWGQAGTAAILALALAAFVAFVPGRAENEAVTRMIDDTRLLGTGAGTLEALAPIYGDASVTASRDATMATTVAIEMGKPFGFLMAVIAAICALSLLQAALKRGRDHVYSACGGGCVAVMLISVLSNGGSLTLASAVVLSAILGLAIAQSKGDASAADASELVGSIAPRAPHCIWCQRSALAAFALLLAAQGGWILLPEVLRAAPIGLPVDRDHATVSRQDRERAVQSARIAGLRGDLWAESAFSEAAMVWTDPALKSATSDTRHMTSSSLLSALRFAPHRSDVWLMLAATCERLGIPTCNVGAFLKMSYYTAPDRTALLPLRLMQALRNQGIGHDEELTDMLRRDIRFVLLRAPELRPALLAAYRTASPAGRRLVEQTVAPVAPGYLTMLRSQLI